MTTSPKTDCSHTSNLNETIQTMLDHLITIDDKTDDTVYNKRIRTQIKEPNQTADDNDFTPAEVMNAIEVLKNKTAPGKTESQE